MADYHPLLVRALGALPENGPDERGAIYERARDALVEQLRSVAPALSESDIVRERQALDAAIERVEAEAASGLLNGPEGSERLDDDMPEASRPEPGRGRPAPKRGRDPVEQSGNGRERPRVAALAPRVGRRQSSSAVLIGLVLLVVIGSIAAAAWVLRDRPGTQSAALPAGDAPSASGPIAPLADGDAKYADRVSGGGRVSPAGPASNRGAAATPPRNEVAIAQRAILMEENTADPRSPKITGGRALWRVENVNAGQGQPLETVVRADVEVPEANLSLSVQIRRNLDPTLPASHTVQLTFKANPANPDRAIKDIGLLQLKNEETVRGTPVAGLPVPVTENVFLIGLSDLRGDIERNADLLLHRNWIDLPIRLAKGQRIILSFEKGLSGEQAMNAAFRQWGQL